MERQREREENHGSSSLQHMQKDYKILIFSTSTKKLYSETEILTSLGCRCEK